MPCALVLAQTTESENDFCLPESVMAAVAFPKDVAALAKTSKDYNYDFRILDSVMQVNAIKTPS